MKIGLSFIALLLVLATFSCKNNSKQDTVVESGHEVVVKEIQNASSYTYLLVTENNSEFWIAIPKTEVLIGETYYYEEALEMLQWESKDLNVFFDKVYFVEKLSTEPKQAVQEVGHPAKAPHSTGRQLIEKHRVSLSKDENSLSIADVYKNKDEYANKSFKVVGQIVKINTGIMNRNWVHIQDGIGEDDNYDLIITTTQEEFKVGDIVSCEGKLTLDKDFGHGYAYDVIIEDGELESVNK